MNGSSIWGPGRASDSFSERDNALGFLPSTTTTSIVDAVKRMEVEIVSYSLGVWQAMLASVYVADKVRLGEFDFVPTSRIAQDLNIPAPSLARLLARLHRAGIIETREGAGGGVRLAVDPDQVTLLGIVDAIEQNLPVFRTDSTPRVTGETPTRRQAALRQALDEAEQAMRSSLEAVTMAAISEI
ncbi:MAG: Rrf2 family transcriptional regulator [Actinobacteria bacterium]|nr:Rrf2 family transcriptional regulator [Actinomycetota bacterium]